MKPVLVFACVAAFFGPMAAQAQDQAGGFHDCWRAKRVPTFAISAVADGVPLRLSQAFYPERAARMRLTGQVELQCSGLGERLRNCAVAGQSHSRFDFAPVALHLLERARIDGPTGAWPLDVTVTFQQTHPGDPTLIPCPSA